MEMRIRLHPSHPNTPSTQGIGRQMGPSLHAIRTRFLGHAARNPSLYADYDAQILRGLSKEHNRLLLNWWNINSQTQIYILSAKNEVLKDGLRGLTNNVTTKE
jgi:hypothetical protein